MIKLLTCCKVCGELQLRGADVNDLAEGEKIHSVCRSRYLSPSRLSARSLARSLALSPQPHHRLPFLKCRRTAKVTKAKLTQNERGKKGIKHCRPDRNSIAMMSSETNKQKKKRPLGCVHACCQETAGSSTTRPRGLMQRMKTACLEALNWAVDRPGSKSVQS